MTTTEIFKCCKNSTIFDAQNGNGISKLLDFKFFWGSIPPDSPMEIATPLVVTAAYYTFSGRLWLKQMLYSEYEWYCSCTIGLVKNIILICII